MNGNRGFLPAAEIQQQPEEQRLQTAWSELQRADAEHRQRGLEFGRVCYELREKYRAQGSRKGEGFDSVLAKLKIPSSTAYKWITRYEESQGIREPQPQPPPRVEKVQAQVIPPPPRTKPQPAPKKPVVIETTSQDAPGDTDDDRMEVVDSVNQKVEARINAHILMAKDNILDVAKLVKELKDADRRISLMKKYLPDLETIQEQVNNMIFEVALNHDIAGFRKGAKSTAVNSEQQSENCSLARRPKRKGKVIVN